MADVKQEFRDLVANLKEAVEHKYGALNVTNQEAFTKINERLDAIEFESKQARKGNPFADAEKAKKEELAEFKSDFLKFVRKDGRDQLANKEAKFKFEGKSTNIVRYDLAAAGALLLPPQIGQDIIKNVVESSPVMQVARVTQTTSSTFKRRVRTSTPGATWLSEAEAGTKSKPTYVEKSIPVHKLAARYAISIEMEQDSAYDLQRELVEAAREDFAKATGTAFISGDGVGKPYGMVGRVSNFNSASLSLNTNLLIQLQESLKEDYQKNASWMFTRSTRAYIRSLVLSSTNGLQYTWEPDFKRESPTLLLGSPVYIVASGDLAGKVSGNFTAADVPILYGDFRRGYEVTTHTDFYVIDDLYSEASSYVRNLHIMGRYGGNVTLSEAIVQLTITSS